MKTTFTLIVSLFCCLGLSAQSFTEYFSVGNPLKYCDTAFSFAWSANPHENYYVQEYLPQGESLEHYTQMFNVSVIFWDRSPLDAVQAKIAELDQRKKIDPVTNYMAAENNGEYILEFIVSDSNNGKMNTVELDVHHYKHMTINGKKATVLSFYSSRAYGDDITAFIQSIPQKRSAWYEGMSNLKIKPEFPKK